MEQSIVVALITVAGSILVAAVTFYLTKRAELDKEWRQEKLNHYKILVSALSDLAVDGIDKEEANMKFCLATNTIALSAPQDVITALMEFHDEVKFSNPNKSSEKYDKLLINLLLAIRKDIGLSSKDDESSFTFHLIGSKPKRSN